MNKLDELIKNHTQQAKGYYEGHFLKPLHRDTAAALAACPPTPQTEVKG